VTQDNQGKKTAGVDGIKSLTPPQRLTLAKTLKLTETAQPTRRVWIPKPGTTEKRGLGIPVMRDRAAQALVKLALEPEWEAHFEPNSYGFRPGRSKHDAIEAIFTTIKQKAKFVLDADIAKCFDRINHNALLNKLHTSPRMRRVIKEWLKAGVMDGGKLFPTEEGTPQGGVVSPLLANIALHGLETAIRQAFPQTKMIQGRQREWQPYVIRYADDFVALHEDETVIKHVQQLVNTWLAEMGLELKPSKTRITHTLTPKGQPVSSFWASRYDSIPLEKRTPEKPLTENPWDTRPTSNQARMHNNGTSKSYANSCKGTRRTPRRC
jgi:RNA-directed DNA polymerase